MLTDEQIAEIRARTEAATPGPWFFDMRRANVVSTTGRSIALVAQRVGKTTSWVSDIHDADNAVFIVHAREAIPALLADREELQRQMAEVERKVAKMRHAIESVKAQADATPVGAEDEVKGASVYNWLIYVYRLLKPALEEDEP